MTNPYFSFSIDLFSFSFFPFFFKKKKNKNSIDLSLGIEYFIATLYILINHIALVNCLCSPSSLVIRYHGHLLNLLEASMLQ